MLPDTKRLRSAINDRDREFTLGLDGGVEIPVSPSSAQQSCTYLSISHHHYILLPSTFLRFRNPPPLFNKASAAVFLTPSILVSYPKKVHYRTHLPAPHEASARISPHLLTNTLLIFFVACPVLKTCLTTPRRLPHNTHKFVQRHFFS